MNRAERQGNLQLTNELWQQLAPLMESNYFHVNGYSQPKMIIYTSADPLQPQIGKWMFHYHHKWNDKIGKYLNSKAETLFQLTSFKDAAKYNRCLLYLEGFYEHHHHNGKAYPFYIYPSNAEYFIVPGIWNEWVDTETGEVIKTFSIVTTKGNSIMSKIHNNPKLEEPRMPVLLPEELADKWLMRYEDELSIKELKELLIPCPDEELSYHTVGKLRGKEYKGNSEEITEHLVYEDLDFQ